MDRMGNRNDPVQRLVDAVLHSNNSDGAAAPSSLLLDTLAYQIAHSSSIGRSSSSSSTSSQRQRSLASTFRRIERMTNSYASRAFVLHESRALEYHGDNAHQIVELLSRLGGSKRKGRSSNNTRRNTNTTKTMTTNSQQQRQQQRQQQPFQLLSPQVVAATNSKIIQDPEQQQRLADETRILRECLYALQGMDGDSFHYDTGPHGHLVINYNDRYNDTSTDSSILASRLGSGARQAWAECGRAGWYYRRIRAYIEESSSPNPTHIGSVHRALAAALDQELQHYHALLAQLEHGAAPDSSGITLRQLTLRLRAPARKLRTMAVLTDGIGPLWHDGGSLLAKLYQHALHGDTQRSLFCHRLVFEASKPWFDALYQWTLHGILDPSFFIREKRQETNNGNGAASVMKDDAARLWHDRYEIVPEQVPVGILDEELVMPCFNAGKGINFIRKCLQDSDWKTVLDPAEQQNRSQNDEDVAADSNTLVVEGSKTRATTPSTASLKEQLGFQYDGGASRAAQRSAKLSTTLLDVVRQVDAHIATSLRDVHHLQQHLRALKQFYLLGQGDFFSALVEGLRLEFDDKQPRRRIYDYSLMAIVDTAIQRTNAAQLPPYVLRRVGVKLKNDQRHRSSGGGGGSNSGSGRYSFAKKQQQKQQQQQRVSFDTGTVWDVFRLDYNIPEALTAILHPAAMDLYQRVFDLLFGLKRVEFMLNLTWRQSTALHHAIQTLARHNRIEMTRNTEYAQATTLLRHISMTRQCMMHFVVNLKSYLFFEVLEGAWNSLDRSVESAASLEELIDAHDKYLADIIRKSLLEEEDGRVKKQKEEEEQDDNDGGEEEEEKEEDTDHLEEPTGGLSYHLQHLLSLALAFCDFQEDLFRDAIAKAERATEKVRDAERRLDEGGWGFDSATDVEEKETLFGLTDEAKIVQVMAIGSSFAHSTQDLLTRLYEKSNGTTKAGEAGSGDRKGAGNDHFDFDSLQFLTFQLDYSDYYGVQK